MRQFVWQSKLVQVVHFRMDLFAKISNDSSMIYEIQSAWFLTFCGRSSMKAGNPHIYICTALKAMSSNYKAQGWIPSQARVNAQYNHQSDWCTHYYNQDHHKRHVIVKNVSSVLFLIEGYNRFRIKTWQTPTALQPQTPLAATAAPLAAVGRGAAQGRHLHTGAQLAVDAQMSLQMRPAAGARWLVNGPAIGQNLPSCAAAQVPACEQWSSGNPALVEAGGVLHLACRSNGELGLWSVQQGVLEPGKQLTPGAHLSAEAKGAAEAASVHGPAPVEIPAGAQLQ
jgi:hypothetical protein